MNPSVRWGVAFTVSLAVHLLAGFGLAVLFDPLPVPQQRDRPSAFELTTLEVSRRDASERNTDGPAASLLRPPAEATTAQGVPQRYAQPISQTSALVAAAALGDLSRPVIAGESPGTPFKASTILGGIVRPKHSESLVLASALASSISADNVIFSPVRIEVVEGPKTSVIAAAIADAAQRVAPGLPTAEKVLPAKPIAEEVHPDSLRIPVLAPSAARPVIAGAGKVAPLRLEGWQGTQTPAQTASALPTGTAQTAKPSEIWAHSVIPQGSRLEAGLAWSGAGQLHLDSDSLAAIQVFMAPETIGTDGGTPVRDRIAEAMAGPACARVQTVFNPETGALELRGHVPTEEVRIPLIQALRANVGNVLEIKDALQLLPPPQCGILDGMADLGLPQSEEQLRDPHLIGENAQVREYQFQEGDRLVIDLVAPDYEAYVYVDYFDAEGQVIHLVPNDRTPIQLHAPKSDFSIGRATQSDASALDIRIGPPFGQDIAVAIASDRQLYAAPRPIFEPAQPYLAFLKDRVAALAAQGGSIRGEWVYIFVGTSPKSD